MQLIPNKAETETMRKVTYNGIIFPPTSDTNSTDQEPVVTNAGHSAIYET